MLVVRDNILVIIREEVCTTDLLEDNLMEEEEVEGFRTTIGLNANFVEDLVILLSNAFIAMIKISSLLVTLRKKISCKLI